MPRPRVAVSPPSVPPLTDGPRLLDKREVMDIVGRSYTTIWEWIVAGKFPKARMAGKKLVWLSTDIEAWIANLPPQQVKDPVVED